MDISKYTKLQTLQAIEAYWKKKGDSEERRRYLGASAIGHHCDRKLWYDFRHCTDEDFSGRLYRLFNRGHREEATFVEELRAIGCEVHETDENGQQFGVVSVDGHFRGHTDGAAVGIPDAPKTWHLLEFKTSSAKEFKKLEKDGVEKAKPVHYAQMQVYMYLTGLTRALYLVVNKDNDELYGERIEQDKGVGEGLIKKASRIIYASRPPERCTDRPDTFACKFCSAKSLCWNNSGSDSAVDIKELSCRQCAHSTPNKEGSWTCEKTGGEANEVCDHMVFIPELINFAEPTNFFEDHGIIEFTTESGNVFYHGPLNSSRDTKIHTAKDLINLPKTLVDLPSETDK